MALTALGAPVAEPGLSDLGQGINAYNSRQFASAIQHLRNARGLTQLADYVTYHLAYSQVLTGDVDGALTLLTAYRANPVSSSPLAGKISLLYGRTLLDKRTPETSAKALNVLQTDYSTLPQPDGDFALGLAYEALDEKGQAALSYERAFYLSPNTDVAAQASTAIDRLRASLGKDFPAAPATQQLTRCERWLDAKQYVKARQEYVSLAETLTGPEKDQARVGIGVSDYMAGKFPVALRYLKDLHVTSGEADATRLYYLTEAARQTNDDNEMLDAVKGLERYAQSPWRLKALMSAGNRYVVTNQQDQYTPLFKAAYDAFPPDTSTAYCHWKVAWDAYLTDKPERTALLREQVDRYTDDSRASSALYFLGRIAEANVNYAVARAYYDRLSTEYPHYFYGVLARQRIKESAVASATPDPQVSMWLAGVSWPARRDFSEADPNDATRRRIARSRLLIGAGQQDLAEAEIRFGAKTEGEQPQLLALEFAQSADSAYRALRIMKSFSADYLALPLDKAPVKFWQMLFPMPYKDDLIANAKERGLDPYDVAALIRQESEFNPQAKSPFAYGLMQIRPATGRMLGKQEGMGVIATNALYTPSVSLKLGTEYMRQQLKSWDNDIYRMLAAYNAGPGRVQEWLKWMNYREPAEFVESIPFTQTREYVQAVLRNADIYREIYLGKTLPPVQLASLLKPPAVTKPPAKKVVATAKAKKSVASRHSTTRKKHEPA
jgi:soluble lytic murein transglycosylase